MADHVFSWCGGADRSLDMSQLEHAEHERNGVGTGSHGEFFAAHACSASDPSPSAASVPQFLDSVCWSNPRIHGVSHGGFRCTGLCHESSVVRKNFLLSFGLCSEAIDACDAGLWGIDCKWWASGLL